MSYNNPLQIIGVVERNKSNILWYKNPQTFAYGHTCPHQPIFLTLAALPTLLSALQKS